jgi:hypothetical protein
MLVMALAAVPRGPGVEVMGEGTAIMVAVEVEERLTGLTQHLWIWAAVEEAPITEGREEMVEERYG